LGSCSVNSDCAECRYYVRYYILIIINVLNTRGGFFTITNFLTDAHFILITKGLLDSNESRPVFMRRGEGGFLR